LALSLANPKKIDRDLVALGLSEELAGTQYNVVVNLCDNMGPNFWEPGDKRSDEEFLVGTNCWQYRALTFNTPLPNYDRPQKDLKDPLPSHI